MIDEKRLQSLLLTHWGPQFQLRPVQKAIIDALLSRSDALILLPTGAGKSLCFQLSGLYLQGITLVISPLLALMQDQVQGLQRRNIQAAYLHGQLTKHQRHQLLNQFKNQTGFLYLAPEQLQSQDLQAFLKQTPPQLVVLDEAHCLSLWGHDFRPEYQRICSYLSAQRPPIAAFTATAPPHVLQDLEQILDFKNPRRFEALPLRDNLALHIRRFWTPRSRMKALKQYLAEQPKTLIYTATRTLSDDLVKQLQEQELQNILGYHAGLSPQARQQAYQKYLTESEAVMVATKAFGMGIDIPDIAQVIHWQKPDALENYVQEVGRAGRAEGMHARAVLLHLRGEKAANQHFIRQYDLSLELIRKALQALDKGWDPYRIQDKYGLSQMQLNLIQGVLQETLLTAGHNPEVTTLAPDPMRVKTIQTRFKALKNRQKQKRKAVQNFFKSHQCRLRLIDRYFGQPPRPNCGRCDNCLNAQNRD